MDKEEIEKLFDNEIEHSFRIGTNGLDEYVTESAKRCAEVAFTLIEEAKLSAAAGFAKYISINEWQSSNGLWYTRNFGKYNIKPELVSVEDLYAEYQKHKQTNQ